MEFEYKLHVHAHINKCAHALSEDIIITWALSSISLLAFSIEETLSPSLPLSPLSFKTESHYYLIKKKVCFFKSLSKPNTFASPPTMTPEQPCDKYPPTKEAMALISVHFRLSSGVLTTATKNSSSGKKNGARIL